MKSILYNPALFLLALESTKAYTGTKALLDDGTKVIMVLLPLAAFLMTVAASIVKMLVGEQEAPIWTKKIRTIWISAGLGFAAAGVINMINHYYGGEALGQVIIRSWGL